MILEKLLFILGVCSILGEADRYQAIPRKQLGNHWAWPSGSQNVEKGIILSLSLDNLRVPPCKGKNINL